MARLPGKDAIYEAADVWRKRSLREGKSVLADLPLWTEGPLAELKTHFVDNKIEEEGRRFWDKLEEQLKPASSEGKKLAAEMLWLLFLYQGTLLKETKRDRVRQVWGWSDDELDTDQELLGDALLGQGIGDPGRGYSQYRWLELELLVNLMQSWRSLGEDEQDRLLRDPWTFAEWVDRTPGARNRQFRDILLHLLFPENFERISRTRHKKRILNAFESFLPESAEEPDAESELVVLDQKLLRIRNRLDDELDLESIDFYRSPLNEGWHWSSGHDEQLDILDALEERGQVVLYGPPGTGKTYEAEQLARKAVKSAVLANREGAFFKIDSDRWEEVLDEHIVRRQLHPAYSYEDFVVGLRINEDGGTEYQEGLLLRLLDRIRKERRTGGEFVDLPYVLILDEINRADLARLLGEIFSALEHRGKTIAVPARIKTSAGERELELTMPKDLYIIGTMNQIDQSLEQFDFALRRRFAWFERRFDEQAMMEVASSRWENLVRERDLRRDSWKQVRPDVERLRVAAKRLNAAIAEDPYLGPQYEIGHTYFSETLSQVANELGGRAKKNYLWTSNGPRAPVEILWDHHIRPLLESYVDGLEAGQKRKKLKKWKNIFFTRPEDADV